MRWQSAVSTAPDTDEALAEVVADLELQLDHDPDLLVVFASPRHAAGAQLIGDRLRDRWPGAILAGCSAGGVVGGGRELEGTVALSVTAAVLPDVEVRTFHLGVSGAPSADSPAEVWHQLIGVQPEVQPVFVILADPFTCDGQGLARVLDRVYPRCPKVGGLASGGSGPGTHVLWADGILARDGAVVLALWGDIELTPVVAQGVRPLGQPLRITKGEGSYAIELEGRSAVQVFQALFSTMSDRDRRRFRAGPVVAVSVEDDTPRKGVPGPHEWLVRNLMGMDPEHGVIGVGGRVRTGQFLRFMIRDASAAADELQDLLQLHRRQAGDRPYQGALLFSCLGRGQSFFDQPDHDSGLIQEGVGPLGLGGFFCNGELGPVHGRTFLHGYTASIGLFRPRAWD